MNVREAAPSPPKLTENAEEDEKRELAELFLQEVAWRDPYIPDPYIKPIELTENVDEGKKPTRTESWERMLKEVSRHDEDMVKGWRDDIDTLLVFAGLFSAVVTAFAIESYQWLDKDPADTTVALLTQLISVQINGSQTTTSFEPTQFKPDASSIRINIFWFLSLILSLASALFGLLCKQWVREHQRDTTTRTSGEALALRQLRRDSFEKWGVSSFLSALPILLEVAPLFFFIYNVLLASVSSSDYFAPIPEPWQNDPPTLPDLDHVRYSIETKQDVQVDYNQVLDVLTSNGVGDAFGVGPSEGVPIQHPQNFSAHNVDINVNALLGTRSVDNMIRVHGFEVNGTGRPTGNQENFNAGGDGSRIHQDNTQGDTMKGLDSAKQINTGMLGDSTGELSDITGDSYSLRR
ncbi:hypothetical protein Moror_13451 [Moniliophthora roreri MCA 2997]|uniref:DUF6535 domain-containing protein n=1 Tax=Moniliophthora roreri (strain MCA 2997) TaxID=1381753 RepID=V2WK94_MONRO|nr:hypothetical protein Moror_13451 [Moniliophthora roreri MCA 2997]